MVVGALPQEANVPRYYISTVNGVLVYHLVLTTSMGVVGDADLFAESVEDLRGWPPKIWGLKKLHRRRHHSVDPASHRGGMDLILVG